MAQPEISHEAAEQTSTETVNPHRREFSWYHTRQPPVRSLARSRQCVFLQTVWCRQRWWDSEAAEVSVRRDL